MPENIDVEILLSDTCLNLQNHLTTLKIDNPLMIGIHSGGVWVAERLHQQLKLKQALGSLNIAFYRDDFTRIGIHPQVTPSSLPFDVDGQHIILVDDVLHTGRTIRAALNEIFDYGRPSSIILVTLVDRPGRELPITADISGRHLPLNASQHVKLSGPKPLQLHILESK